MKFRPSHSLAIVKARGKAAPLKRHPPHLILDRRTYHVRQQPLRAFGQGLCYGAHCFAVRRARPPQRLRRASDG